MPIHSFNWSLVIYNITLRLMQALSDINLRLIYESSQNQRFNCFDVLCGTHEVIKTRFIFVFLPISVAENDSVFQLISAAKRFQCSSASAGPSAASAFPRPRRTISSSAGSSLRTASLTSSRKMRCLRSSTTWQTSGLSDWNGFSWVTGA